MAGVSFLVVDIVIPLLGGAGTDRGDGAPCSRFN